MAHKTIQAAERRRRAPEPPATHSRRRPGGGAERVLTYTIVLFQISALVLLALKSNPVDRQALILAAVFPLGTLALTMTLDRIWHIDRALLLMVLLLCSIGMVTLQDITQTETAPQTGAVLYTIHMRAGGRDSHCAAHDALGKLVVGPLWPWA